MNFFKCKFFVVGYREFAEYQRAFNRVNVMDALMDMNMWLEANPKRRKKNYKRFIVNWLKADQREAIARHREASAGQAPSMGETRVKRSVLEKYHGKNQA